MMGEPVFKPIHQLQVHLIYVLVQPSYSSPQAGRNCRWCNFASLGQNSMVIHKFVLRHGQLEKLGENGVDCNVFWLPSRMTFFYVPELVELSCSFDKGISREVTIKIDEEPGSSVTVVVEDVYGVDQRIS